MGEQGASAAADQVVMLAQARAPSSHGQEPSSAEDQAPWESDPECGTMKYFGEGMAAWGDALREALYRISDIALPDLGLQYEPTRFAFALTWAWSVPFGPEQGPLVRHPRHCAADRYEMRLRPSRVELEAGVFFTEPATYLLRLGYGYVWQAHGSRLGLGTGFGSTLSWREGVGFRPSLSPELVVRHGQCCGPGYLTLSLRYDRYFAGEVRDSLLVKFGFMYY
jgi:hypothetical protein